MSRRLQVLFLLALLGVLVVLGIVVQALTGWVGGLVYTAVAACLLVVGTARARAAAATPETGRTCTCCTSTVHDPVEVR